MALVVTALYHQVDKKIRCDRIWSIFDVSIWLYLSTYMIIMYHSDDIDYYEDILLFVEIAIVGNIM